MGLVILLIIAAALLWIGAVLSVAWMLTHPPRRTYAAAVARKRPGDPSELQPPREFEQWSFQSRGLDFPVWDVRGDLPAGGPIIILCHGWADSRIGGLLRIAALAPFASRLILWDSRGHGEAPGTCALGTTEIEDLAALLERAPDSAPRVLYGWSLGAGVSIAVGARGTSISAIIAESPYRLPITPARNVLRARGLPYRTNLKPAMWLMRLALGPDLSDSRFDRAALAADLRCPFLVVHGEADEVCPVDDGRETAASAPNGSIAVIPGGRHNDLWTDGALANRCTKEIGSFLSRIIAPAGPST
jgi:pimeloyl-ACP methyl ester carboxylesterase